MDRIFHLFLMPILRHMKKRTLFFSLCCSLFLCQCNEAQTPDAVQNIIIVTTDGFRWQEMFNGMDSALANDPAFNQGKKEQLYSKYGAPTPEERRKKLLPFTWGTMAGQGQLYGNRKYGNKVEDSNPYWFSYPGYSEIFCGYVDTKVNSNDYMPNPNTNVLEFLQQQNELKGKVAAFGAWNAFDRILNEQRSGFPVVCGSEDCGGLHPDSTEQRINKMKKESYNPFDASEQLDVFTHSAALHYLQKNRPRVLYISYGETDEWAHNGHYLDYLDAAHRVDAWLGELWAFVQNTEGYKGKTILFITVDHGRGEGVQWTSHNSKVPNSFQTWFAVMGAGISGEGEIKKPMTIYQKQYAQSFAGWLGYEFKCEHEVAEGVVGRRR